MKNFSTLKIGSFIVLLGTAYLTYYLLLKNNTLHTSIGSIIKMTQDLPFEPHLLVVGLIPIYVGIMVFGTNLLGIYCGNWLQNYLTKRRKKAGK